MSVLEWRGIYAIMITPFNDDLSVDWDGLRANTEFLAKSSADVLVALGSEGEFYALTDAERRRVVETVARVPRRGKPLVVGVSHPSTIEARALAQHAASAGADAVMATAPYYVKADDEGLRMHFSAIADGGRPTFLYNSPGRVGYGISVTQIASLVDADLVSGVKQAAPDLSELAALVAQCGSRATVVGGAETVIWPALALGAAGNTATAASAIPDAFAAIWRASRDSRSSDGERAYLKLEPLREAYRRAGGQAAVVKRLMELVGLAGGPPRPPLRRLDASYDTLLRAVIR